MSAQSDKMSAPGAEHARAFYKEWDFAKKAVCLYAAGVAWGGATIEVLVAGINTLEPRGQIEEAPLRVSLPDWIIDGHTALAFSLDPPIQLVQRGAPNTLEVPIETVGPSGLDDGVSLLWPACVNHETLKELSKLSSMNAPAVQQLDILLDDAHGSLRLPRWSLDPVKVALASADVVTKKLHFYRLLVDGWRRDLALQVGGALRDRLALNEPQIVDVFVSWNREWLPQDAMRGWAGVYDAFEHCGLTLVNFGQEFVAGLRKLVEAGLFSGDLLAGWEERGL